MRYCVFVSLCVCVCVCVCVVFKICTRYCVYVCICVYVCMYVCASARAGCGSMHAATSMLTLNNHPQTHTHTCSPSFSRSLTETRASELVQVSLEP